METNFDGGRKRGTDAFLDGLSADPARLAKRGRCAPSAAGVADFGLSYPLDCGPVEALRRIFPHADPQVLQNYFEASGEVLDAAITAYKDYLAYKSTESTSSSNNAPAGNRPNLFTSSEVDVLAGTISTNSSECAELLVKEIFSTSDLFDAKNRAFWILESFQKSTLRIHGLESIHQELKAVQQMLGFAHNQNSFWKQRFNVLCDRLKNFEEMVQERSQFNLII